MFEIAMENKPSVFEPLKFYCIIICTTYRFTARITELIKVLDELNAGKYERTMVSDANHKVSDSSTVAFKPGSGKLVIQDHLIR